MNKKLNSPFILSLLIFVLLTAALSAQKPYRIGTTAASFLEIGFGASGNSMGDAYVSIVDDISAVYWNPAGLARLRGNEAIFNYQPWLAGINTSFAAIGIILPSIGTVSVGIINSDYGDMDVTTLQMQDGTGEKFTAQDLSLSISFARKLADWFSFGASIKYITSSIWHVNASAIAADLGVIINTNFFSPTGEYENGLNIGMSISNYGTPMKYEGIDLTFPVDIDPNAEGNYRDTPGRLHTNAWELPLLYRLGVSMDALVIGDQKLTVAVDALHPNNNSEYINSGLQYSITFPTFGRILLRGGYKGLFMENSQYGLTAGMGIETFLIYNKGVKLNYSFREHKVLGNTQSYEIALIF